MRKVLLMLVGMFFVSAAAQADVANGEALYKKCIMCHGKDGYGVKAQKAPRIAGQHSWYIESSINDMQSGKRVNAIMMPYIKKLSETDIKDLSEYISQMP